MLRRDAQREKARHGRSLLMMDEEVQLETVDSEVVQLRVAEVPECRCQLFVSSQRVISNCRQVSDGSDIRASASSDSAMTVPRNSSERSCWNCCSEATTEEKT